MKSLASKFRQREFVQNILTELIANLVMLIGGLIIGYYLRMIMF